MPRCCASIRSPRMWADGVRRTMRMRWRMPHARQHQTALRVDHSNALPLESFWGSQRTWFVAFPADLLAPVLAFPYPRIP